MAAAEHFDAVIIGSGFGGSVMAYRLGEAGRRVCLLERGRRYPPGSFARSPREMRNNFWDPSEGQYGLFQVWRFAGIDGVVSSGLGGGSLIYANVFIRKDGNWFYRREPDGSKTPWPLGRADLDPHYDAVEKVIGLQKFPIQVEPYAQTPKTRAFRESAEAAGLDWFTPELAVTFGTPGTVPVPGEPIVDAIGSTTDNLHGRTRYTCRLCGECDVGCNYGSKNTLDYTYLTLANRMDDVQLRDLCEVREFAPRDSGGYEVRYVHHDLDLEGTPSDTSHLPLLDVTCDHLVLSAGTFGSAFLMLKNRANFPGLCSQLGRHFSGNGDFLGLFLDAKRSQGGKEVPRILAPSTGSVITSAVRVPDTADGGSGPGYYIQDGGYPGFVDWLVEESNIEGLLNRTLRFIVRDIVGRLTHNNVTDIDRQLEQLVGDARSSSGLLPMLGMGLDTPGGKFSLDDKQSLELSWRSSDSMEYFGRVKETMWTLADRLNARFEEDPLGHLHNKVITVHPVGGCSMGRSIDEGVINSFGEVFGYKGFVIADGSVMPGPVGPNPSFTIAALSNRFADRILGIGNP
jgi:cholesterol oxidase